MSQEHPIPRRAFLAGAGASILAASGIARAQQRLRRLASVSMQTAAMNSEASGRRQVVAFYQELRRLGFEEGRNLIITHWSGANIGDFDQFAREIVATKPELIFVGAGPAVSLPLARATQAIPIVVWSPDPVRYGLVASLARPGGNVTGFSIDPGTEIVGKRLQLLTEIAPKARRIAYMSVRVDVEAELPRLQMLSSRLGLALLPQVIVEPVTDAIYRGAFDTSIVAGAEALMVGPNSVNSVNSGLIAELALAHHLPSIGVVGTYAEVGGLLTHRADSVTGYKGCAGYVARILNGTKPSDLPVQLPREFEFVINKRTADALGLEIPLGLWVQATEILE